MAKDFRASQIQTSKLIASGGIAGTTAGIAIYSGSNSSNTTGGITDSNIFDNVGSDVFLFVSGTATKTGTTRGEIALFGGDVVISGTLYAERQIIEVDSVADGDFFVTGNLYAIPDSDSTSAVSFQQSDGTTVFNLDSTNARVGIGIATPLQTLSVVGSVSASLGLSGSLTRLVNGTSYLAAGSNVTITSASNGQVTIASSVSDTQNTLDQAYDEGGAGLGAKITVDSQPIQMEIAGANKIALAVTGAVIFGSASADLGNHLPGIPNDTSFFVSGNIGKKGIANTHRGMSVIGGDFVVSGASYFETGLSGSLTRLTDGTSFIAAGSGATITSASNGQITISSAGTITALNNQTANRLVTIGSTTTELDGEANLTYDGTTISLNDAVTINEAGGDNDFRVESQDVENAILVDASTNQVLILSGGSPGSDNIGAAADVAFFVSGGIGRKGHVTPHRGVAVFGGDLVSSGTSFFYQGISGSITRLTDGTSFIAAGSNVTITSASNGQISIASSVAADTQNTLDEAYDEDGTGLGAKITVDGQPVQLEVAGANEIALAVTGAVVFGSGSMPTLASDIIFYVSGAVGTRGTAVRGASVFNGDLVVSGGAYFNLHSSASADFRVETDGEDEALFIDGSANALHINKGETAFETHIYSTNDVAMSVTAAGVVFNEDSNNINDFRIESDSETHFFFIDAGLSSLSIGDSTDAPGGMVEITNGNTGLTAGRPLLQLNNEDLDQICLDINAKNTTGNIIDITSDDRLTTGKALFIDINNGATSAVTPTYMHFDFDKDGINGDGVTSTFTALSMSMNDAATNHANSNVTMTGLDIALSSSHNQGTLKNLGASISVLGADTTTGLEITTLNGGGGDIKIMSSADSGDYFSIATTTHGATTVTTVDDDAAAADLTLTIDGDTIIQAEGTSVARAVGTATSSTTNCSKAFSSLTPYISFTSDGTLYPGDSGAIVMISNQDVTVTLPDSGDAATLGCRFTFIVNHGVAGDKIITCADTSNEQILGKVQMYDVDVNPCVEVSIFQSAPGEGNYKLDFNGTTTGAVFSKVELMAVGADQWFVISSEIYATGATIATPFASS